MEVASMSQSSADEDAIISIEDAEGKLSKYILLSSWTTV